jgi:hypothetical protein
LRIQPRAINVHGGAQGVTSFDELVPKRKTTEIFSQFGYDQVNGKRITQAHFPPKNGFLPKNNRANVQLFHHS